TLFPYTTLFRSISNLTLPEAEEKIQEDIYSKTFQITENGQEVGSIQLGELEPELQTGEVLTKTYNSQNPNEWITGYFQSENHDGGLMETMNLDEQKLNKQLADLGLSNEDRTAAQDATIEYTEAQGYYVTEAEEGNQLDIDKVQELIMNGVQNGEESIEINSAYLEPEVSSHDEKIDSVMEK